MANPYVGEIRLFAGNFEPQGWAFCNGQILSIAENQVLFALIGTTYGGDGQQTFALPNLQSRVPIHFGNGFVQAQTGGAESHALTVAELPAHNHAAHCAATVGNQNNPGGNFWSYSTKELLYSSAAPNATMNPGDVAPNNNGAGAQPHENRQPFLAVSFIISLFGIFPSQN